MLTCRSPDKRPDIKDTNVIRDGVPHSEQGEWCSLKQFVRDLYQMVSHSNWGSHLTDSSKATGQSRCHSQPLVTPQKVPPCQVRRAGLGLPTVEAFTAFFRCHRMRGM